VMKAEWRGKARGLAALAVRPAARGGGLHPESPAHLTAPGLALGRARRSRGRAPIARPGPRSRALGPGAVLSSRPDRPIHGDLGPEPSGPRPSRSRVRVAIRGVFAIHAAGSAASSASRRASAPASRGDARVPQRGRPAADARPAPPVRLRFFPEKRTRKANWPQPPAVQKPPAERDNQSHTGVVRLGRQAWRACLWVRRARSKPRL
jgi:hypothetical protein